MDRSGFANPAVEAAAERDIQSLKREIALQPLGPILLRSEGIASSRIEGEVASTRRVFEAEYAPDDVQSAVSYTRSLATRLEALAGEWRERLAGTHEDALARRLVAELSARPVLSASDVAECYDVTARGARAALDDLVDRGILTVRSLRKAKRGRPAKVYEATELFSLLDLTPRDLA